MADLMLLRLFSFLSADETLSIDMRFAFAFPARPSLLPPCPLVTVRFSLEQYDVGRVDNDASDRVLPGFARSEASVISDNDETTWSSGTGTGDEVSWDGVTDPSQ